jgi:hypothetical protein
MPPGKEIVKMGFRLIQRSSTRLSIKAQKTKLKVDEMPEVN